MEKFNEIADVIAILPKYHPRTDAEMVYNFENDKIRMSCIHKGKNNRWKNRILNIQNQPKEITIPRFIKLDEKFGELIGLYYGDGTKNASCIEFANFCPKLLEILMSYLSSCGISNKNLEYRIKISDNVKLKYEITESEIIEYWRNRLDIPIESKVKTNWVKSKGAASDYLRRYGTLVIRYHNSMFALFFNSLIKNVDNFIKSESFKIGFLRGLIAAEGNINTRRNGSLSLLRIAGSKNIRDFISKFLNIYFHIRASDDWNSNQIYIGSIKQFELIKKFNLHALHPEKCDQFERGYKILLNRLEKLRHDNNALLKNKKAISILSALYHKPLYYKEILKFPNISRDYLKMLVNGYKTRDYKYAGLQKIGVLEKTKHGREFILSITDKGKLVLEDSGKTF